MSAEPEHPCTDRGTYDYSDVSDKEWAEYEFATIEYDYKIPPEAAKRIRHIFAWLTSER